ncbi:hypothetical protein CI610_01138 [invertebrate metagenome]|uniref:Uncharacterized protein n=1 Tax=invertebrate metagenome TaxID=1711999 RepID=A0A2H9T9I0_9ZZZZ
MENSGVYTVYEDIDKNASGELINVYRSYFIQYEKNHQYKVVVSVRDQR